MVRQGLCLEILTSARMDVHVHVHIHVVTCRTLSVVYMYIHASFAINFYSLHTVDKNYMCIHVHVNVLYTGAVTYSLYCICTQMCPNVKQYIKLPLE